MKTYRLDVQETLAVGRCAYNKRSRRIKICSIPTSTLNSGSVYILVGGGWNMAGLFFHSVGKFIIQTDELHDFSEGLAATTNQSLY